MPDAWMSREAENTRHGEICHQWSSDCRRAMHLHNGEWRRRLSNYQSYEPCVACGEEYLDRCFHHVKSRGSGGTEDPWNRISLCFLCHELIHRGVRKMPKKKFINVLAWLRSNGWDLVEEFGREKLRRV